MDGIPLRAAGMRSFFHQPGNVFRANAVGSKGWNVQFIANSMDPFNSIFRTGAGPTRQQTRDFVEAAQGFARWHTPSQNLHVDPHAVWKKRGADGAMRDREHSSDGSSEAMDNAKTRVGECHTAQQAGECHVRTCLSIVPVVIRPSQ